MSKKMIIDKKFITVDDFDTNDDKEDVTKQIVRTYSLKGLEGY